MHVQLTQHEYKRVSRYNTNMHVTQVFDWNTFVALSSKVVYVSTLPIKCINVIMYLHHSVTVV